MKTNLVASLSLVLCAALSPPTSAADQKTDRTVLPVPPPSFHGKIDVPLKGSKSEWPEPVKAPKGAPNVLLIMGDDIGYAHMSSFGGPANTPTFDRLAKQGLRFNNFHTTRKQF